MSELSDSDPLAPPRSPGLEKVEPRLKPSPTPPPFPASQKAEIKRKKPGPTQGDVVLLGFLGNGNHPDVATRAGREALRVSESDEEMEDLDEEAAAKQGRNASIEPDLPRTAQKTLRLLNETTTPKAKDASILRKDSSVVVKTEVETSPIERLQGLQINGVPQLACSETDASLKSPPESHKSFFAQGYGPEDSLINSPVSAHMKGPDSAAQKLPAFHSPGKDGAESPQNQKLPHFSEIFGNADQTNHESDALRNRQSSFSMSPTIQFTVQQRPSAGHLSSLNHASPLLISTETSPRDYRQGISPHSTTGISSHFFQPRRTSAASETSPTTYQLPVASTSTSSTDGTSPSTQPTPIETHHLNIEANTPVILPPPISSSNQQISAHGGSGFKCNFAGCTAPPFQTQYLLKFVHLSSKIPLPSQYPNMIQLPRKRPLPIPTALLSRPQLSPRFGW